MAATLVIGGDTFDLHYADVPHPPLADVPALNPQYRTSGLILPPQPDFPAARLNAMVWPVTGMSHYAYGHVLVANEVAYTSGTACTLEMSDAEADTSRDISLYVLDRRPFIDTRTSLGTAPANTDDGMYFDGWVLTLVDVRYLRRAAVKPGDTIGTSSWGDLIHDLGTLAGFTMQSASTINALIHADFSTPVPANWTTDALQGESYAVACDAAAYACGLRVLITHGGDAKLHKAATSEAIYATWLTDTGRDAFRTGGITLDRYATPLKVRCDGTDVTMPSPTPRLSDTDTASLERQTSAFQAKWLDYFSDWENNTQPHGDLNGLIDFPLTGTLQHAQYLLPQCITRLHAHPARHPLPFTRNFNPRPGATAFPPGPCVDVVSKLCQDEYGVITVEYKTICLPPGGTVSDPWCLDPSTDCCDGDGGGGDITPGAGSCSSPASGFVVARVSHKTFDCVCMPDTLNYGGTFAGGSYNGHEYWNTATCPGNPQWDLICRGGVWELWVGSSGGDPPSDGVQCTAVGWSATSLVFDSPDLDANCGGAGGSIRITFTAT